MGSVSRVPRFVVAVVVASGVVATALAGCRTTGDDEGAASTAPPASAPTTPAPPGAGGTDGTDGQPLPEGLDAVVTSVTDGDTVVVRTAAGVTERVRLIGIDTPETRDPRRGVECFGAEASAQTERLVPPGTEVRLERDAELRDRYERLLAYVWRRSDGLHVNARLVEGGWAVPYRYPPNVRYAELFSQLGAQARVEGRGLWSACR